MAMDDFELTLINGGCFMEKKDNEICLNTICLDKIHNEWLGELSDQCHGISFEMSSQLNRMHLNNQRLSLDLLSFYGEISENKNPVLKKSSFCTELFENRFQDMSHFLFTDAASARSGLIRFLEYLKYYIYFLEETSLDIVDAEFFYMMTVLIEEKKIQVKKIQNFISELCGRELLGAFKHRASSRRYVRYSGGVLLASGDQD